MRSDDLSILHLTAHVRLCIPFYSFSMSIMAGFDFFFSTDVAVTRHTLKP